MINRHKYNEECRNCGHWIKEHCYYSSIHIGDYKIADINVLDFAPCEDSMYMDFNTYPPTPKVCGCKKFEPKDNLEYLEVKAQENTND
jgi:hypothetical protein